MSCIVGLAFGDEVAFSSKGQKSHATLVWEDNFSSFPDSNGDGINEWHPTYGPNETQFQSWQIVPTQQAAKAGIDVSNISTPFLYRAEIHQADKKSHRAYPLAHFDDEGLGEQLNFPDGLPSPLVNQWLVWWDPQGSQLENGNWMHFATWANNVNWIVNTLCVVKTDTLDYALDLSGGKKTDHVEYFGDREVPTGEWIRFTAYLDYTHKNESGHSDGIMVVWMNGNLIGIARGGHLSPDCPIDFGHPLGTTKLLRAHWGLYASSECEAGLWYESTNRIWHLDTPLKDFSNEPHFFDEK